jgi:Uma2 family endonuclease
MAAEKVLLLTPAEYLAWEARQSEKHEYISGEILNMAGASSRHNRLCVRALTILERLLETRECLPFPSDQRVRVREMGPFFYPDISVACEPVIDDNECLRNPVAIFEVLSESTDHLDRGEKWSHYRQLPSLRHYVLLSQSEPLIEHYSRESGGQAIWQFQELRSSEATLTLTTLDIAIPLAQLYQRLGTS